MHQSAPRPARAAAWALLAWVLAAIAMAHPAVAAPAVDYQRARFDPIHFQPAIAQASDAQCLACHEEVLKPSMREQSPAGVKAATTAWYQQTNTYQGAQETFHRRHLSTPLARSLMDLRCNTCHEGHDQRDEHPLSSATSQRNGGFPAQARESRNHLPQVPWPDELQRDGPARALAQEQGDVPEQLPAVPRGDPHHRHQVNYLKAEAIEAAATGNAATCATAATAAAPGIASPTPIRATPGKAWTPRCPTRRPGLRLRALPHRRPADHGRHLCDHNCGSRHMLVAHKKGDVIVRLSTDDGRYQEAAPSARTPSTSRSCAPACAAAPTARACIRPSACSTR
jgi:hypothetical protein